MSRTTHTSLAAAGYDTGRPADPLGARATSVAELGEQRSRHSCPTAAHGIATPAREPSRKRPGCRRGGGRLRAYRCVGQF